MKRDALVGRSPPPKFETRRASALIAAAGVVLGFCAFAWQDGGVASSPARALSGRGWRVLSVGDCEGRTNVVPSATGGVEEVLWRRGGDGLPRVSSAGFVQVREEGRDFFYANVLEGRRKQALRRGEYDTENWGDVDAFRTAGIVLRAWRGEVPGRSRIGVEDISSEFGGFGDYDKDGVSDHRTHQLGANLNLLLPTTAGPEVEVFFGIRHEGRFDRDGARALAVALFRFGGQSVTTTSATKLLDPPEAFPMPFRESETPTEGSRTYRVADRHSITLMNDAKNHGNHFNARLTPVW